MMQTVDLHSLRLALLLALVVATAESALQASAVPTIRPASDSPENGKRFHMQAAPNPPKPRPPVPETVGATSAPFELGKGMSTASFAIHAPAGPGLLRSDGQQKRVLLRFENVTSTLQAPSFNVYLNQPPGADPEKNREFRAFTMSTFGLVESSEPTGDHPGDGLSFLQDVTDLYVRLTAARDWDGKTLRVSFVPKPWGDHPVKVTVGRVSLVIQ
jgi:tyrosinase